MRDSIYRFTLDVHDISSQVQIVAKKNDNARTIKTNLMEYGKPYVIEEGCRAVIMIKKPDDNILFNDCDISGSEIRYEFTEQTTSVDGLCECEIRLFDPEGETITSPRFTMLVNDTVYDAGQIESTSEFKVLTDAIASADNLNIEAEKEDGVTTVTITHKDGTDKVVNIEDGLPGAIIDTEKPTGDIKPALWINPDGIDFVEVAPDKINDIVTNRFNTWSSKEIELRINATKREITSNLKTINGRSVVGTGNIEIQGGGSSIDDTTTSTDKTWSSSKIYSFKSEFVTPTQLEEAIGGALNGTY